MDGAYHTSINAHSHFVIHNTIQYNHALFTVVRISVMSIDIEKIAHLARLTLREKDKATYPAQLDTILSLAEQMQAIDTQDIVPLAHPIFAIQPLRNDEVTEQNQRELFQSIAPQVEGGLYLVPQVITKDKDHA